MSDAAAPPAPATDRAAALLETITTKILRPFQFDAVADLAARRAAPRRTLPALSWWSEKSSAARVSSSMLSSVPGTPPPSVST
ncbi:hypothetical protein [Rhodococcoides yunnanense]|uniref:hypothetical protein n=1 Tax=Rhodococcoides yunnanense TaxID=278209 RepID=UPI002F35B962